MKSNFYAMQKKGDQLDNLKKFINECASLELDLERIDIELMDTLEKVKMNDIDPFDGLLKGNSQYLFVENDLLKKSMY